MRRCTFLLVGLLLLSPPLKAQFAITTILPADGTVSMSEDQDITITFNAALDTTRRYIFNGHDEIRLPVRVLIAEPEMGLVVQGWQWNAAQHRLTLQMQWGQDREYFLMLDRAMDLMGNELALPVDLHLSTGPDLGARSVGCQLLRLDGGPLIGLVAALFDQPPMWTDDAFLGSAAAVVMEDGQVTIPYVRPGVWYPVAAGDADGDGHLDPQCGDPFGYLDQDGDGMPDSVVVESEDLFGLVIPLTSVMGCTARNHLEQAQSLAAAHLEDPGVQLKVIMNQSESLNDLGQCGGWSYEFWSPLRGSWLHVHFTADVPQVESGGDSFPPMDTLPGMFVDSDIALDVALNHGGHDLEAQLTEFSRQAWVGNFFWMWANPHALLWAVTIRGWTEGGQWRQHLFLVDAQTGAFLGDYETALEPPSQPGSLALEAPYPNPFNASCVVRFTLDRASDVSVDLFDLQGHCLITLASGPMAAGAHRLNLDAGKLPSGLYFLRLSSGRTQLTRRLLLLR